MDYSASKKLDQSNNGKITQGEFTLNEAKSFKITISR